MSSHVDVEKIEPTTFEDQYYDEYEYYNLTDKYTEGSARKGRSKKEASENTNRHNPGGHERKIVEKLQNTEKKAKEQCCNADLVPARRAMPSHEQCNPAKE